MVFPTSKLFSFSFLNKPEQKSSNEKQLCVLFVPFLLIGPVTSFGFHQTAAATVYGVWLSSYAISCHSLWGVAVVRYQLPHFVCGGCRRILSAATVYEVWLSYACYQLPQFMRCGCRILSAATVYEVWLSYAISCHSL